jgi:hypothetical protein
MMYGNGVYIYGSLFDAFDILNVSWRICIDVVYIDALTPAVITIKLSIIGNKCLPIVVGICLFWNLLILGKIGHYSMWIQWTEW